MTEAFVCAFRGRRDSYQVPLALAEGGILDQFITDAYAFPWIRSVSRWGPRWLRDKAEFRRLSGIPAERVRCLWGTTLLEHVRHRLGYGPARTFMKLDRRFSTSAARRARREGAHLFLYSPYAWEAFVAKYRHNPRRVLFQYHPHPDLERRILADDGALHPGIGESFSGPRNEALPEALVRRERDCWQHADLIICASSFTRQSLVEAGADAARCRIVPYGIDTPAAVTVAPSSSFQAVFVGSGGQRKGLHHLVHAWSAARLPKGSKLVLVCRVIDQGIERLLATSQGIELIRGVDQQRLAELYASSTLFVMPSLVEGFGQVYLEALAQGCPILGTANTCLPDLGDEADGVFLVEPGNVRQLTARLEHLAEYLDQRPELRKAARACAGRFTWPTFRAGIRQALDAC